jgi:hypothetical protein
MNIRKNLPCPLCQAEMFVVFAVGQGDSISLAITHPYETTCQGVANVLSAFQASPFAPPGVASELERRQAKRKRN